MISWKGRGRMHLPIRTVATHITNVSAELGTEIFTVLYNNPQKFIQMKRLSVEFSTDLALVLKKWKGNKRVI
jgi:hypothetical protein